MIPEIMRTAIAPRVPPMIAAISVDCTEAIGGISCSGSEAKHAYNKKQLYILLIKELVTFPHGCMHAFKFQNLREDTKFMHRMTGFNLIPRIVMLANLGSRITLGIIIWPLKTRDTRKDSSGSKRPSSTISIVIVTFGKSVLSIRWRSITIVQSSPMIKNANSECKLVLEWNLSIRKIVCEMWTPSLSRYLFKLPQRRGSRFYVYCILISHLLSIVPSVAVNE